MSSLFDVIDTLKVNSIAKKSLLMSYSYFNDNKCLKECKYELNTFIGSLDDMTMRNKLLNSFQAPRFATRSILAFFKVVEVVLQENTNLNQEWIFLNKAIQIALKDYPTDIILALTNDVESVFMDRSSLEGLKSKYGNILDTNQDKYVVLQGLFAIRHLLANLLISKSISLNFMLFSQFLITELKSIIASVKKQILGSIQTIAPKEVADIHKLTLNKPLLEIRLLEFYFNFKNDYMVELSVNNAKALISKSHCKLRLNLAPLGIREFYQLVSTAIATKEYPIPTLSLGKYTSDLADIYELFRLQTLQVSYADFTRLFRKIISVQNVLYGIKIQEINTGKDLSNHIYHGIDKLVSEFTQVLPKDNLQMELTNLKLQWISLAFGSQSIEVALVARIGIMAIIRKQQNVNNIQFEE